MRVSTSAPAGSGTGHRLSLDDWTSRALDLLVSEGVGALKVARLCRELGVTKGSFYWHFADLEALRTAVADRWCAQRRAALEETSSLAGVAPLERIRMMAAGLLEDRSWSMERTLREWAVSDPKVAETIAASERHVFALVEDALRELGHSDRDARLRAGLLVYAGIGFAHGQHSLPRPTMADLDDLVDFLSRDLDGR